MTEEEKDCLGRVVGIVTSLAIMSLVLAAFESCNFTRTVTTTAQTVQKGDTTVVIMTKTIESYDGKVDATKLLQAGSLVP